MPIRATLVHLLTLAILENLQPYFLVYLVMRNDGDQGNLELAIVADFAALFRKEINRLRGQTLLKIPPRNKPPAAPERWLQSSPGKKGKEMN